VEQPRLDNLTAEQVRAVLNYDPLTGVFHWAVRRSPKVKAGDRAGARNNEGYVGIEFNERSYKAHRLAWLVTHGEWPAGEIDHINGDRGDNRIANLRVGSKAQNQQNRKLNKDNTSGHIGVHPRGRKWGASIAYLGKQRYLGTFATVEDAAAAYRKAKADHHNFNPVAREPARGVSA
jgi:hypothetical protein